MILPFLCIDFRLLISTFYLFRLPAADFDFFICFIFRLLISTFSLFLSRLLISTFLPVSSFFY